MRISDWSSDVCSSDLLIFADARHSPTARRKQIAPREIAINGRPDDVRRRAVAFCGEQHNPPIFGAIEPHRAMLVGSRQTRPPGREAGGVSGTAGGYSGSWQDRKSVVAGKNGYELVKSVG